MIAIMLYPFIVKYVSTKAREGLEFQSPSPACNVSYLETLNQKNLPKLDVDERSQFQKLVFAHFISK